MHRFFIDFTPSPGEEIALPSPIARQIDRVLRLRAGERVILLDGSGSAYPLELTGSAAGEVRGVVGMGHAVEAEPRVAITLYAAPLKGDHYAYTLQKGTEIGAAAFVPIITARTIVGEAGANKLERWRRIAREAAEQAGRGRIPPVAEPLPFAAACRQAAQDGPALIPWEESREGGIGAALAALPAPPGRLALLIGPEGGFAAAEIARARECGIVPVTLGRRILRAETAAAVATTLALAALGEIDR